MFAALLVAFCAPPDVCREDLERFPPDEVIWKCINVAREHREWIHSQAQFWPHEKARFHEWEAEAARRHELWSMLGQVKGYWPYDPETAAALQWQLREMLGWPAYYRGEMPLPVPVEYLRIE